MSHSRTIVGNDLAPVKPYNKIQKEGCGGTEFNGANAQLDVLHLMWEALSHGRRSLRDLQRKAEAF